MERRMTMKPNRPHLRCALLGVAAALKQQPHMGGQYQ